MKYLFQLGFAPSLAAQELSAYFSRLGVKYQKKALGPQLFLITTKIPIDPVAAINTLGGTVRIAPFLASAENSDYLLAKISKHAQSLHQSGQFNFALAAPGSQEKSLLLARSLKQALHEKHINARFLISDGFINPIKISTQKAHEYIVIPKTNQLAVFYTQAVSDFASWQSRDRGRPHVDPQPGMLPPKMARILLNLALTKPFDQHTVILDPFCGSGTILAEALILGLSCVGADQSPKALANSQANLDWLKTHFSFPGNFSLVQADATTLTAPALPGPVNAIVFEGHLGPPHFSSVNLPAIIAGLDALYRQALPRLGGLQQSGDKLVMALPKYDHQGSVKMLTDLIDTCENSGYTLTAGPLYYSKPGSKVRRAIYTLTKN